MMNAADICGINWDSSNFRAYRIDSNGLVRDEWIEPAGILDTDRYAIVALMERLRARWPDVDRIFASGMIGSNLGWVEAPYLACPASLAELAGAIVWARIGPVRVGIVPGLACRRGTDDAPDVLRGEELELFGLKNLADADNWIVALPGTHTKWVCGSGDRVIEFATSMTGEIFDRMTASGLLQSIIDGEAEDGEVFRGAVRLASSRSLGLGTLLFGARARVLRGELRRADAASYLRGLLIGSDLADARRLYPRLRKQDVLLVGNPALSRLYFAALEALGCRGRMVDRRWRPGLRNWVARF